MNLLRRLHWLALTCVSGGCCFVDWRCSTRNLNFRRPNTPSNKFSFAVPFTDDVVLQRNVKTAIYGLTPTAGATVKVTVTDASTGKAYSVAAEVSDAETAGGTANALCQQRCSGAGHCCLGKYIYIHTHIPR